PVPGAVIDLMPRLHDLLPRTAGLVVEPSRVLGLHRLVPPLVFLIVDGLIHGELERDAGDGGPHLAPLGPQPPGYLAQPAEPGLPGGPAVRRPLARPPPAKKPAPPTSSSVALLRKARRPPPHVLRPRKRAGGRNPAVAHSSGLCPSARTRP